MKQKILISSLILVAFLSTAPKVRAESVSKAATQEDQTTTQDDQGGDMKDLATAPLEVKKQKVQDELTRVYSKLISVNDQMQVILGQLSDNGIDTSSVTPSLEDAQKDLKDANLALTSLSEAPVQDGKNVDTLLVKNTVKQIQNNLISARENLIQSLTTLKVLLQQAANTNN